MNQNNKTQKLFKQVRQSPTELTFQEIELIIQKIPSLPPKPVNNNNWKNFLTFKNIIMGTMFCVIIGLISFLGLQKESPIIVQNDLKVETTKSENKSKTPAIVLDQTTTKNIILDQIISTTKVQSPTSISSSSTSKINKDEKVLVAKEQDIISFTEKTNTISTQLISDDSLSVASPKIKNTKLPSQQKDKRLTTIPQPKILTDPNYPNLGGLELRRLKKKLLKNLSNDNLITSKLDSIQIELPGDEIIVNGQILNASMFLKYSRLTAKAGFGPEREIQINKDFIKVGDFTTDGFRGSGVGTFTEQMDSDRQGGLFGESQDLSDKVLKKIEMEKMLEEEERNLDLFSQQIINSLPKTKGRKSLFSFKLHYNKTEKLFKALHSSLAEHQLFDTTKGFTLIEISKDMIRINGTVLDQNLYSKYDQLFSNYKIKSGPHRQIRLSQHIIKVGDFNRSNFKGTSGIFENEDLKYFKNE